MSAADVVLKFRANAGSALPSEAVEELEHAILELDDLNTLAPLAIIGEARAPADRGALDGEAPVATDRLGGVRASR
jgi:hypothetical protein